MLNVSNSESVPKFIAKLYFGTTKSIYTKTKLGMFRQTGAQNKWGVNQVSM